MDKRLLYNCHVHSLHSHDSSATIEEICQSAISCGINGIAITDHCDCEYAAADHAYDRIAASVRDAQQAKEAYASELTVMAGVELGDALFDPQFAEKMLISFPYDVILGSVHAVRSEKDDRPFSLINFSAWTQNDIYVYMKQYFADLLETIETFDVDVLSHLTVPLRYISGKYGKKVDLTLFQDPIERILHRAIDMGITLEVNTQNTSESFEGMHPSREIVSLFFGLGGKLVSLGSDAHTPENVGTGLNAGIRLLNSCGIHEACFFRNRQTIKYNI